jgi:hypothetical protein
MPRMNHRIGLTRVDVGLALMIAGIVAALVMVVVMRVREAANEARCGNNLKHIVLACHSFNDANNGRLPAMTDQGLNALEGKGIRSLFFNILPYVESSPLYGIYRDKGLDGYYAKSSQLVFSGTIKNYAYEQWGGSANQVYSIYLDPSDVSAVDMIDVAMKMPVGDTGYFATGSYAANGLVFGSNDARLPSTGNPGTFGDGTAYTILITERPQVCHAATGETAYNLWGLGIYSPHMPAFATLTPDDPPGLLSTGQVAPVVPLPPHDSMDRFRTRIGRAGASPRPADFVTPVQRLGGFRRCDPRLPGAFHFDGMLAAMGDGSVRPFAWSVNRMRPVNHVVEEVAL